MAILKLFGWTRVAAVKQDVAIFSEVLAGLMFPGERVAEVIGQGISDQKLNDPLCIGADQITRYASENLDQKT